MSPAHAAPNPVALSDDALILPARQRRKAERPDELIDAALTLFVEKGFAATRIDEVARLAGVSKGTLYLYYPSKEELLQAVIRERLSSSIAAASREVEAFEGSTAELMTGLLSDWWRDVLISDTSGVFKLVITEVRNFPDLAAFWRREVVEPGNQLIGQILQRGIARGEFRAIDIASTVPSLVLPMIMLCVHRHSVGACGGGFDFDGVAFIRHHMALILHGLMPPAAS